MTTIDYILIAFAIIYWLFVYSYCTKAAIINSKINGVDYYKFSLIKKIVCNLVLVIPCVILAPIAIGERLAEKLNLD